MPRLIIKPRREPNLYVEWSTIVDNLVAVGTRGDFIMDGEDPARFDRADRNGSSAQAGWEFGYWDDEGFIVYNTEKVDAPRWLPRGDLFDYARLIAEDRLPEAEERYLQPLPPEDA